MTTGSAIRPAKRLAVIGEPALPGLRDATNSADAEVKRRATALVSEINGHTADRVRAPFIALVAKVGGRITPLRWNADEHLAVCVDLAGTSVTDADVKRLGKWSEMRELDLSGTNITDDTLASLRSASGLRQLKLDDVAVTACGLPALQGVTLLHALVVSPKTQITDKAVTELRKSLPNLEVTRPGGFSPVMRGRLKQPTRQSGSADRSATPKSAGSTPRQIAGPCVQCRASTPYQGGGSVVRTPAIRLRSSPGPSSHLARPRDAESDPLLCHC